MISEANPPASSNGKEPLKVRTLEILWHCSERNEEAEQLGMQSSLVEGITCIDYNPHSNRIVTTGGDQCIRLWQVNADATRRWLDNESADITACSRHICRMRPTAMPLAARWSPQGEIIASAHCEGKLCLWWRNRSGTSFPTATTAAADGEEEWSDYRHLSGHISDVYDICFSPDSRYLLSGAGDGSITIHDLEGSSVPVVQLTELHTKFCRGVAWDPWNRYISTFGAGPPLQCFIHVPRREQRRMHLAGQRRCQGNFIGDTCALSFRRMSWSPDGSLLAVPYGKTPAAHPAQSRPPDSEAPLVGAGDEADVKKEVRDHDGSGEAAMVHCVQLYARGALDKVAARLVIRGFYEVRGVQWAPCVAPPTPAGGSPASPSPAEVSEKDPPSTSGAGAAAPAASPPLVTWGPADYRMALAAWTSDAIIVYTTESTARHSDFTDLHMRSITDVAWSGDASFLFTASLDGYITVISFGGTLLTATQRLPLFSNRGVSQSISRLQLDLSRAGHEVEKDRSSRAEEASQSPTAQPAAVMVRKKKKTEKTPMELGQLEAPMSSS